MICGTKKKTSVLEKWPWMPTTANVCRQPDRQAGSHAVTAAVGQPGRAFSQTGRQESDLSRRTPHSHSNTAAAVPKA